jgi:hypothetical protein
MELFKWIMENVQGAFNDIKDTKNLYVIGICGKCEHFDSLAGRKDEVGVCRNPKMSKWASIYPPKDFGCIHWEEKE